MKKPKWTIDEEQFLKDNFHTLSNIEIGEKIGRTPEAVKVRLCLLKCVRSKWHIPTKEFDLVSPSVEQAAYLAGHFDGEGCIMLCSDENRFKLRISVQCCHKPVLELYQSFYGGSLSLSSRYTNKRLWRWSLGGYYAGLRFIETIYPYSLEKRDQLEVTREYALKRVEASIRHPSEDIHELARLTYHKLRDLKKN